MTQDPNSSSEREKRLNEVLALYVEAVEAGQRPDQQEWLARYSELATELTAFFANQERIADLAAPLKAAAPAEIPLTREDPTLPPEPSSANGPPLGTKVRYFGDYELLEEIARGGMGVVYKARQVSLNRLVALRMILAGQLASDADVQRFYSEAQTAANLQHPNIVAIHEVGEHNGQHYFSMDYVEGKSLAALTRDHPLSPNEAATIVETVALAINYAHQKGVLHRDLKPANILLSGEGRETRGGSRDISPRAPHLSSLVPRITDFGLAKRIEGDAKLTATGAVLGTPGYMPPEQAGAGRGQVGPASDVYSLGAVLYELVTGRPPFQGPTPLDTVLQVLSNDPVPPRQLQPTLPRNLETICLKCLQKEPHKRYRTAAALAEDLRRFLAGEPILARPVSLPERTFKWILRRPMVAGLLTAVFLVTVIGIAAFAWAFGQVLDARDDAITEKDRTAAALKQAEMARTEAENEKNRKDKELTRAEWLLYASKITLAQREWESDNAFAALEALTSCRRDFRGWEYDYLHTLFRSNQLILKGHTTTVNCVAFSRDGTRVASASSDRTVRVWNAQTGHELRTLKGHTGDVISVAFSPDGTRLASGGQRGLVFTGPGELKVWDLRTGKDILRLEGHTQTISSVSFSPDGKRIASLAGKAYGKKAELKMWDAQTGKETLSLKMSIDTVGGLAFSPDGKRIATGLGDALKVWDAQTGKETLSLKAHKLVLLSVSFSPDGKRIATTSYDGTVAVWDADTGKNLLKFKAHSREVSSAVFSPDGKRIASAGGKMVKLWELETGKETLTLKGHPGTVRSVAFSADGKRLATAGDTTVRLWDTTKNQDTFTIKASRFGVSTVIFSPDGKRIATASQLLDPTVKVWDTQTGKKILELKGHADFVSSLAFSHDGKRLASSSRDGTTRVWDAQTGKNILTVKGRRRQHGIVAFSPDGTRLAGNSDDQTVKVWDAQTGKEIYTFNAHPEFVLSLAFSPDGKRLASGGSGLAPLKLWDVETGEEIRTFIKGHAGAVFSVAFSPDGLHLASASFDATVKVWETETGRELLALHGLAAFNGVAFSPNGKRLAGASSDQTLKLWDSRTGQETITLKGHAGPITSLAFSPDGKRLASAGVEGVVEIWDASEGQPP